MKAIMQTSNKYYNLHKLLQFGVELYLLCLACQNMAYNVIYEVWEIAF